MNRTLLLMRHAKAEDSYEVTDYDRALTTKGWGQAERVGQLLAERGYTPDHVICSAAKRTRQTLEGVLSAMELSGGLSFRPETDYAEAAYLAGADELLGLVNLVDADVSTVLVVGHNPTIAQMAASFVGSEALVAYSPATVAAVDLEVEWLYAAPGTGAGSILN
ncbi:histidine phosphatase family protein [Nocardiopsis exhalans]|uniref:Histidine phosphatase family protein n=1 Tax=Nocardiopsis exhalans TaxID=163604 RepID=A0ABY5D6Z1_9ACTN|nr:histidine phosphatase family protein [Nocardiopsis exhalans]USY20114.1 histidine phosphatase family protein [Nocardiopsis exhalans]